jgi:D-alanyl-D-alanine carboxypeptidase/D-alanyl-D-alanine-endopeptidase (penicillin-binding protein 4)
VLALAIAVVVGVAGCGGGSGGDPTHGAATTTTPASGTGATSTLAGNPPAQLPPPRKQPLSPTEKKLIAELKHQFSLAGKATSGYVFDITTNRQLFALRDTVKRPPASVEKLFTTVAALKMLGPRLRLHTIVDGTGHLGSDGVWHGNLYVRGDGDPTLGDGEFNRLWLHGYGPTASQLADQLAHDGIRRVTGKVYGDASIFDTRSGPPSSEYQPDIPDLGGELGGLTYDHGATDPTPGMPGYHGSSKPGAPQKLPPPLSPGAFTAHQLAVTLSQLHIRVRASAHTRHTPRRARRLASVSSPPLSVMLRLMDVPSDDFIAEMLTKQLGARIVGRGTTSDGALVVRSALTGYGLHPQIVDGSGLSRSDLASPLEVVDLLRKLDGTHTGAILDSALPTVGVDGTVQTIATGTPAVGRCIAKTGTLNYVTNLAGYCHSRGRQLVAFAFFVDGPPNWSALTYIGRMVAAAASY